MTADRGYGEARVDQELAAVGVARVAIPRRGRAGPAGQAVEHRRGFRLLVKWRTGCEGRISIAAWCMRSAAWLTAGRGCTALLFENG